MDSCGCVYCTTLPWDYFYLYCGVAGTNEVQMESEKGKKMMGSAVIGTP